MRRDWVEVHLGEFIPKKGNSLDPRKFPEEVFELYSVPSHEARQPEIVEGKTIGASKQLIENNWVLLSRINPHLNRCWVVKSTSDKTKIASSEWVMFPPNRALYPDYLGYYLVQSRIKNLMLANVSGVGGSLTRTNKNAIREFDLMLPPLPEQRAIVTKLEQLFSELDCGVAELKAAQDKLKIYRQAVLKKAFEGTYSSVENSNDCIINGMEASIPKSWKISRLGEHIQLQGGFAFKSKEYVASGIPIVKIKNVHYENIDWSTSSFIESSRMKEFSEYKLEKGDVLIAMTRPFIKSQNTIKTVVVRESDLPALLNQRVGRFKIKGDIDREFLKYFLFTDYFKRRVIKESSSSQQPNISSRKIEDFDFILPTSRKEQHQIVQEIESRLSVCDKLEESIATNLQKADALRQSILKKAFEGRLLTEMELESCRKAKDWCPAGELVSRSNEIGES